MLKQLRAFFENQKREGERCEKILGNSTKVAKFAQFYKENADELAVISAGSLIGYLQEAGITTEKAQAFKEGLAELPIFLEKCFLEHENKNQESPQVQE